MESLIIEWNGTEVPDAFRQLPPGRYVVETLDEAFPLTEEEEAGIQVAIDSFEQGRTQSHEEVMARAREVIAKA
jgi:hypothetical protein